ncbi:MAG: RNA polymerase sigma factor [Flavobacteriales bacterium]
MTPLELLEAHAPLVRSLIRLHLGNGPDAEDAWQDIYLNVHRGWPTYRGTAAPRTWLYRVALNSLLTHHRRSKLRRTSSLDELPPPSNPPPPGGGPPGGRARPRCRGTRPLRRKRSGKIWHTTASATQAGGSARLPRRSVLTAAARLSIGWPIPALRAPWPPPPPAMPTSAPLNWPAISSSAAS